MGQEHIDAAVPADALDLLEELEVLVAAMRVGRGNAARSAKPAREVAPAAVGAGCAVTRSGSGRIPKSPTSANVTLSAASKASTCA
jgi:hypothetical protein